jgi:hypothetical protein
MDQNFVCPHCASAHQIDDSRAGTLIQCRHCGQGILVPGSHAQTPRQMSAGDSASLPNERSNMTLLTPTPTRFLNQITRHIDRTVGPSPMAFHEIISTDIHLDLHIVPPHAGPTAAGQPQGRDFFTVVTSGMSSRLMPMPPSIESATQDDAEKSRYAELMISLPRDWPGLRSDGTFVNEYMSDEANWWPIRWLKMLARMPHEYDTWIGAGYTVPNTPSDQPYAPNTGFSCLLLLPSALYPAARHLVVHDDITIEFLALWPLYPEELELKLSQGLKALQAAFAKAGVTDLLDIHRPNVAK